MKSSIVIESLLENAGYQHNHGISVCVAYIYCDYGDAVQQTPLNILGAILSQAITFLSGQLRTEVL
jgi:hypothetical protein